MVTHLSLAHFSLENYHQMIENGLLVNRRVELIDGLILEMSPEGTEHTYFSENLGKKLEKLLEKRAYVRENKPITLSNSEPEPDIAVVKLPRSQYIEHHPYAENILLLVEISKSTLDYDTSIKKKIYAKENIPEYWVVDVNNRKLIVYRSPGLNTYEQTTEWRSAQKISPLAFPDINININDIFCV
ncbi:MAG: Uma2 family endonuclease [Crocosphaera sp.]|nr:Uma2 family endonuclease [Crocosphaera sp.]